MADNSVYHPIIPGSRFVSKEQCVSRRLGFICRVPWRGDGVVHRPLWHVWTSFSRNVEGCSSCCWYWYSCVRMVQGTCCQVNAVCNFRPFLFSTPFKITNIWIQNFQIRSPFILLSFNSMILSWMPPGYDFIMIATRIWFYYGQAMILIWLPPGYDIGMAVARPLFWYGCCQAMILLLLPPGHDFIMAASTSSVS